MAAGVVLIVVSYNTCEKTRQCLEHLIRFTDVPFHIWAIDNRSTDGSLEMLENVSRQHPDQLSVVTSDANLGYAGAVQLAYPYIPPHFDITYVNSDAYVGPSWASRLQRNFQRNERIAAVAPLGRGIGGKQDYVVRYGELPGDLSREELLYRLNEELAMAQPVAETAKTLMGTVLMVNREAHDDVGGLDPRCAYGADDADFCLRARLKCWELLVSLDTFVYHDVHSSFNTLKNRGQELNHQSWAYFNRKWRGWFEGISWSDLMENDVQTDYPPFLYKQYF